MKKKDFIDMMVKKGIADKKYMISGSEPKPKGIILFCPVTVPQVVDYDMVYAEETESEKYEGMFQDPDFVYGKLRLDLIWGYFSSNVQEHLVWRHGLCKPEQDYESPEKVSRLEGELRRFGADILGKTPHEVIITPHLINTYCSITQIESLECKIREACGYNTRTSYRKVRRG